MSSQRTFLIGLGLVAVAGAAWVVSRTMLAPDLPVRAAQGARDTTGFQGYVLGSADAPVEIVEYGDFQCPACANWDQVQFPTVKRQLIETGKLRYRYRDYPLDGPHMHARLAAHAAACADEQGKYWEMHQALFHSQPQWQFAKERGAYDLFGDQAAGVGADRAAWEACMKSGKYAARIEASSQEGIRLGVNTTPTMLFEGNLYPGGMSSDSLATLVNGIIARRDTTP